MLKILAWNWKWVEKWLKDKQQSNEDQCSDSVNDDDKSFPNGTVTGLYGHDKTS
jgi:hypothetical protein